MWCSSHHNRWSTKVLATCPFETCIYTGRTIHWNGREGTKKVRHYLGEEGCRDAWCVKIVAKCPLKSSLVGMGCIRNSHGSCTLHTCFISSPVVQWRPAGILVPSSGLWPCCGITTQRFGKWKTPSRRTQLLNKQIMKIDYDAHLLSVLGNVWLGNEYSLISDFEEGSN